MKTNIPVFKIVKLTLKDLWIHKGEWTRVMFAPYVLIIVGLLGAWLYIETAPIPEARWSALIAGLPLLLAIAQMHINGYRYVLLGEGENRWWTFPLNKRILKLGLYGSVLGIIGLFILGIDIANREEVQPFLNTFQTHLELIQNIDRGLFFLLVLWIASHLFRFCLSPLLIALDHPLAFRRKKGPFAERANERAWWGLEFFLVFIPIVLIFCLGFGFCLEWPTVNLLVYTLATFIFLGISGVLLEMGGLWLIVGNQEALYIFLAIAYYLPLLMALQIKGFSLAYKTLDEGNKLR